MKINLSDTMDAVLSENHLILVNGQWIRVADLCEQAKDKTYRLKVNEQGELQLLVSLGAAIMSDGCIVTQKKDK